MTIFSYHIRLVCKILPRFPRAMDSARRATNPRLRALHHRGGPEAAHRLFDLAYDELRAQARRLRLRHDAGPALNTTALVHEAYLRLAHRDPAPWRDREHFLAIAATAMRHVLVDGARRRRAQKRNGLRRRTPYDDDRLGASSPTLAVGGWEVEVLDLDAALQQLEALSPRLAAVVELRFFGGLTVEETAGVLDLAPRTVDRDWFKAKAALQTFLEEAAA